ncbi:MAG: hypothetical protein AB1586_20125 [Pseudomonadota bacterium]
MSASVTDAGTVQSSYYSEFMKNYAPELPIDAHHGIEAVEAAGQLLVFSVGTDSRLYLLHPENGAPTGWRQRSLFAGAGELTGFDLRHDGDGSIRLGMAIRDQDRSHFYMSAALSAAQLTAPDFDPGSLWREYPLPDPAVTINAVEIDLHGALIAAEKTGQDATYYLVDEHNGIQQYTLPEDGDQVRALALGRIAGERGVFLLYDVAGDRTMLFQSFPDPVYNKTSKYRFDAGNPINDFVTLPDAAGNDQLFVAGAGISLFPDPFTASVAIAAPDPDLTFQKLRGSARNGKISLWLLGEDRGQRSGLYFVTNHFYSNKSNTFIDKWAPPLRLQDGVGQFAPVRGDEISNHLFLISPSNELAQFWQDSGSTLWKLQTVPVEDVSKARELDTFTLHVQFSTDGLANTLNGRKVKLSTSSAIHVTTAGAGYRLGPQSFAEVELDMQSSLHISTTVASIKAPILYIEADFLAKPLMIDLAHKLNERLRGYKTGDDLDKARKQDNTPLIPPDKRPGDLGHIAGGVQTFLDASDNMNRKATGEPTAVKPYFASMSFSGGKVTWRRDDDAVAHFRGALGAAPSAVLPANPLAAGDIFSDFGHAFGSFIDWLGDALDKVSDFFIHVGSDAVNFAIKLGEDVYNFVLTTAEQVFAAVEWLFKKIYVFFKDLVLWLAFLFNWPKIVETAHAVRDLILRSLDGIEAGVGNLRRAFDSWIDDVIANKLDSPELADALGALKGSSLAQWHGSANGPKRSADPRSHWITSKMHYISPANPDGGEAGNAPDLLAEIASAVEDIIQKLIVELAKFETDLDGLVSGRISIGDFALDTARSLAAFVLEIARKFIDIILDAIAAVIAAFKSGLEADISIPFLPKLFSDLLSISGIDLISFVIAVPLAITYFIKEQAFPFDDVDRKAYADAAYDVFRNSAIGEPRLAATAETEAAEPVSRAQRIVSFALMGTCRLLRGVTFPGATYVALSPDAKGTSFVIVLDSVFRYGNAVAASVSGDTSVKTTVQMIGNMLLMFLHGLTWGKQQQTKAPAAWTVPVPRQLVGRLGETINFGAMLDAAIITGWGSWNAVATSQDWDKTSDAQRAAQIQLEIFQIPAILGFLANVIAKNAKDPETKAVTLTVAVGLAGVRELAMVGSAAAEFAAAIEA